MILPYLIVRILIPIYFLEVVFLYFRVVARLAFDREKWKWVFLWGPLVWPLLLFSKKGRLIFDKILRR